MSTVARRDRGADLVSRFGRMDRIGAADPARPYLYPHLAQARLGVREVDDAQRPGGRRPRVLDDPRSHLPSLRISRAVRQCFSTIGAARQHIVPGR
jgi:hypothetical protein